MREGNIPDILDVVSFLAESPDFKSHFDSIYEKFNLNENKAISFCKKFSRILKSDENFVYLMPDFSVCDLDHVCYRLNCPDPDCDCKMYLCPNLHVCYKFLFTFCNERDCKFSHILDSFVNRNYFESIWMHQINANKLRKLLKERLHSTYAPHQLKICYFYNERKCNDENCSSFHMCMPFVSSGECYEGCYLNHDVKSRQCWTLLNSWGFTIEEDPKQILKIIQNSKFVQKQVADFRSYSLSKSGSTWDYRYNGEVAITEICYDSIHSYCLKEIEGCPRLHSKQIYHWQFRDAQATWINFAPQQSRALERAYCEVEVDSVAIPNVDQRLKSYGLSFGLCLLFYGANSWQADFDKMCIKRESAGEFEIRRLCQEYKPLGYKPVCYKIMWYFLGSNDRWISYDEVGSDYEIDSDKLELLYKKSKNFGFTMSEPLVIDTTSMVEINLNTLEQKKVRRRPFPHLDEESFESSDYSSHSD